MKNYSLMKRIFNETIIDIKNSFFFDIRKYLKIFKNGELYL